MNYHYSFDQVDSNHLHHFIKSYIALTSREPLKVRTIDDLMTYMENNYKELLHLPAVTTFKYYEILINLLITI